MEEYAPAPFFESEPHSKAESQTWGILHLSISHSCFGKKNKKTDNQPLWFWVDFFWKLLLLLRFPRFGFSCFVFGRIPFFFTKVRFTYNWYSEIHMHICICFLLSPLLSSLFPRRHQRLTSYASFSLSTFFLFVSIYFLSYLLSCFL
jgi:hypothetical protein